MARKAVLMNLKSIIKLVCAVNILVNAMFYLPIFVGLYFKENITNFAIYNTLCLLISIFLYYKTKYIKNTITIKQSIIAVNLIWIILGIQGSIPFIMIADVDFINGAFEAISGFTTTGASIFKDIESLPKSILFLRSLTQWLGGLGIVVLSVGLLSIINSSGSLNLFKAESTGINIEKNLPKMRLVALSLWGIYLGLTIANIVLLSIFGMDGFDALNHALSTMSTGGFSTKNASMGFYENPSILWTTTIFMLLGGTNFLIYFHMLHANFKPLKHEEFKAYIYVFITLSLLLTFVYFKNQSYENFFYALTHCAFSIASVMTTTGFVTLDYESWGHLAIMIVFLGMISSAMAGSTSGGIKIIRHVIFFKNISLEIKRTLNPLALSAIYLDKKIIPERTISSVFGFFSLFCLTVVAIMFYLFAVGYDELTAISTAISAVANIGPGFGMSGPSQNYSSFTSLDKIVLIVGMIIGRLECYTFLMMLTKSFWKKF